MTEDEIFPLLSATTKAQCASSARFIARVVEGLPAAESRELFDSTFHNQKHCAEYLGVAPPTISGWNKLGEFPAYAVAATVSLRLVAALQNEKSRFAEKKTHYQVVRDRDEYLIVKYDAIGARSSVATILARGIPDEETARELAKSYPRQNILDKALEELWHVSGAASGEHADWFADIDDAAKQLDEPNSLGSGV